MTRTGWLLFAVVAVLWGVPFLLIKVAVDAGVTAVTIAFARVALGAALLLPLALARRSLRGLAGRWRILVLVAACDVAAPFVLIAVGEHSVSSSLTGILVASTPLFVAVLALRFDHDERPGRGQALGLVLGFAGVTALLGLTPGGGGGSLGGAALILLASVGYAVATLLVKRFLADAPPEAVGTATLSISTALLAAPAALTAEAGWPSDGALAALAALGLACTGLAFWAYYALIATVGATRAAVSIYLTPGVAVVCGVTLLGEPFTPATALGLTLVLAGSWLSTRARAVSAPPGTRGTARTGSPPRRPA